MRTYLLLFIFTFLLSFSSFSQTNVSGTISTNTTWTKASSPYVLNGDITVADGAVLTLEPGTILKRGSLSFQVFIEGAIKVAGQEIDSVYVEDGFSYRTNALLEFKDGADLSESSISYLSAESNYSLIPSIIELGKNTNSDGDGSSSAGELRIENSKIDGFYITIFNGSGAGKLSITSSSIIDSEIDVEGKFVSELEISDSYLNNTDLRLVSHDFVFLLKNSRAVNGYTDITYDIAQYKVVDSEISRHHINGASNTPSKRGGEYSLSGSKFINSRVRLPESFVSIDKSIFYVSQNVTYSSTGHLTVSSPIVANGVEIENSQVFADGGFACLDLKGTYVNAPDEVNLISNSFFQNKYSTVAVGAISVKGLNGLTILNSNFDVYNTQAITNYSEQDIEATNNHFEGYSSVEEIEQIVFHQQDAPSNGLVDFSSFSNSAYNVSTFSPPRVVKKRKSSTGDFIDELGFEFLKTHSQTDKLRIYKIPKDAFGGSGYFNREFVQEVESPFSAVSLSLSNDFEYLFTAVKSDGTESFGVFGENDYPELITDWGELNILEDESLVREFKVFDREGDIVQLELELETDNENLADLSNFEITELRTESDTVFYQLEFTPNQDMYGDLDLTLKYMDGLNSASIAREIKVLPVNEYKPELTDIWPIVDGVEDRTLFFDYLNFWYRVISSDQDGDEVRYLITELISGKLEGTFNGEYREAQVGDTLYRNDDYRWTPPQDQFGDLPAFKLRATDGELLSNEEKTAIVQVEARNDRPIYDEVGDQIFQMNTEGVYEFLITGISPGPYEEESVTMEMDISYDNDFVDGNDVTFEYLEDKSSFKVKFNTNNKDIGITDLRLRLSDGLLSTVIYQPVIVLPYPNQIDFVSPSEVNAYAELEFNHIPEVETQIPVQVLPIELPESLSADLTWRVATFLGTGVKGDRLGGRISAQFNQPNRLVKDSRGNYFVMDRGNFKIYKVTPSGEVSLFAGGTHGLNEGVGSELQFKGPSSIAIDGNDNLYVTDNDWEDRLIKITPEAEGTVIIGKHGRDGYVDGPANVAELLDPSDVLTDSQGNIYIIEPIGGHIRKLDTNNNVFTYFKTNEWAYPTAADINSRDEIIVADHFSHNLYKVKNGVMEIIPLPNQELTSTNIAYLTDDVVVFNMEVDNLLKLYTFNLSTKELHQIAGAGNAPFIEEGNSLHHSILGFELFIDDGRILVNDERNGRLFIHYKSIDEVKGVFDHDDVGEQELSFIARDIFGVEEFHNTVINVSPSDKVDATNLNQSLTYTEDQAVDLEDVVISGTTADELIEAVLVLKNPGQGILSAESGSGESYLANSGEWSIIGTTGQVNAALAQVQFIPTENLDKDSQIEVRVIRNGGHVPNIGTITLEVTPINDPLTLDPSPVDSAYSEIPYYTTFNLSDPDDYFFGIDVLEKPEWLTVNSFLEVSRYSGNKDERFSIDGNLEDARFSSPSDMALLDDGSVVLLDNYQIRKITPEGDVITLAGSTYGDEDGPALEAKFSYLQGLAVSKDGTIFFGDSQRLKMLDLTGNVKTIAGNNRPWLENGWQPSIYFSGINDIEISPSNELYILDGTGRLLRVSQNRNAEVVFGDGRGYEQEGSFEEFGGYVTSLSFSPNGRLILAGGWDIYEADLVTEQIRKLKGSADGVSDVKDVEVDDYENIWFIDENKLKLLKPDNTVATVAGSDKYGYINGKGEEALFYDSQSVLDTGDGKLLITESYQGQVRKVELNHFTAFGTPSESDLGDNQVIIQFKQRDEVAYLLDMQIDVRSSGMPLLVGMGQTFSGAEDDSSLKITGLGISEVPNNNVELSLTLSEPLAGTFSASTILENEFNVETGEWKITGSQSELNDFLNHFEFFPNKDAFGNIEVNVEAKRENGLFSRNGVFHISLTPSNDLPVLITDGVKGDVGEFLEEFLEIDEPDDDLLKVEIADLPNWATLGQKITVEYELLAGLTKVSTVDQVMDGDVNVSTISSMVDFYLESGDEIYWLERSWGVRKLQNGIVSTVFKAPSELTHLTEQSTILRVFNSKVYLSSNRQIFEVLDETAELIAGNYSYGDVDGDATTEAQFREINDFIPDEHGGFYISDKGSYKIKHLSEEGVVTTFAGNGTAANYEEGDKLNVGFYDVSGLRLDAKGDLLVSHNNNRRLRMISNSTVTNVYFNAQGWGNHGLLFPDGLGGVLVFGNTNTIALNDLNGNNIDQYYVYGIGDGSENNPQLLIDNMAFNHLVGQDLFVFDSSNNKFWKLNVGYKYKLFGIPQLGDDGVTQHSVTLNDGRGALESADISITIASPDIPNLIGLNQSITYTEGDGAIPIKGINITDEENESLVLTLELSDASIGVVSSDFLDLSNYQSSGKKYQLKASTVEVNQVLSSLSFNPKTNNERNGVLYIDVLKEGEKFSAYGTVELLVNSVNDAPQILNLKDTTAFIGDSLAIVVDAFDIEDGKSIEHLVMSKPDWLNHMRLEARDETVAGNPKGGTGFETKSLKEAKFHSPGYLDFDIDGNLLVADAGLHSILKLDLEKDTVSVFAGSLSGGNKLGAKLGAEFNEPGDMAVATDGTVYVADKGNNQIKAILPSGEVALVAGSGFSGDNDGSAETASFSNLKELYLDKEEQKLYVNDNGLIRIIGLKYKSVWRAYFPVNIHGQVQSFYLADNGDYWVFVDYKLYQFDSNGLLVSEFGSTYGLEDGSAVEAKLGYVTSILEVQNELHFVEYGKVLRKIDDQSNVVTVLGDLNSGAKSGINGEIGLGNSKSFVVKNGAIYFTDYPGVRKIVFDESLFYGVPTESDLGVSSIEFSATDSEGLATTKTASISVFEVDMPTISGLDTALYVKEKQGEFALDWIRIEGEETAEFELSIESVNSFSYHVNATPSAAWEENLGKWRASGSREELNNLLSSLTFSAPSFKEDIFTFTIKQLNGRQQKIGSVYLFAEPENDAPEFNMATTYEVVAGETLELKLGGTDSDGDYLAYKTAGMPTYASADSLLLLQKLLYPVYSDNLPDSILQKQLFYPSGLSLNPEGKVFYTDRNRHQIRVLDPISGVDEVYAGTGTSGMLDGPKEKAEFSSPYGLLVDNDGNLIVSDFNNASLRKITPGGDVSTIIGTGPVTDYYSHTGVDGDITVAQPWNIFGLNQGGDGSIYMAQYLSVAKLNTNGYYEYLVGDPNYPDGRGDIDGNTDIAKLGLYVYDLEYLSEDSLLIWDASNRKLKLLHNEYVTTIIGNGGVASGINYKDGNINSARIGGVWASTRLKDGRIIFSDATNNAIRMLDLKADTVYTVLGKGYAERVYGKASEIGYQEARDFLELDNGDILVAATGRIDRLTHSVNAISFNPQITDVGQHKFTLKISDGRGGTISEEITINVVAPNTAPEALDVADVTATYGDGNISVSLFEYFNDKESSDNELTYEASLISNENVVGASPINSENGVLSLSVIGAGESGVTVVATDPEGLQASTTFKVTVAQAEASVVFGTSEFINDETAKSVEVTTVPEGLSYTITYNGIEELPSTVGEYDVVVTIDEDNYFGSESTTLSIQNIAPEALSISNLLLFENQEGGTAIGGLTVVDQNPSDTHTYTLESGVLDNDLFGIDEGGLVSNTSFNFEEQATYQVAVEVMDNYGGTFAKEFTIEIQDVNEAPTIDEVEVVEIVKNLGQLSIDLTGIGAGEELDQEVTVTASVSGIVASAQVSLQEGNTSATLIFETNVDQEGEGLIAVSVKDNGGTENGGVDELVLEIPIKVLSPNIQVVDGSNCGAGIVTLTASGAESFVWYDSPLYGNSISTDNQLEVDLTNSKVYYVSGVFDGLESNLRVPVNALIFDELTVPEIQNIDGVLSTGAVDGLSYQWLLNGSPIDGATSNEYTPEETGNYAIEIINENGCMAVSANLEVVITAIESGYEALPMRAYPSPADQFITLEFDVTVNKGATVQLIDQSGRVSVSTELKEATQKLTIDVSSVASGIHTVVVKDGVSLSVKKVMIRR
ncbi:MBG domain-containing protein [Roseivirga pacifica]|uniref:MBG domain-containing protein n=1 Tax=Roseivirga pacifica TaxID=1267423 RepID=UPI002094DF9C|nr:MBG domain-containing protein [Roseivirga pacifica]MCO6358359.1 T9SS type A sorting domain-containing protein [Roseivirga pacifica]MCO6366177.1 T9SS type A sorting domain-containing protein [Roseivirga pacifica]MCO6369272.1 T9SS type A sorting domain-containing protein [Roseivirga pacifica]MCO6374090.1 T9SS type A sorting domain-containing protein [Roseivirga pacifica]MCO6378466.1 T9SS type A sorting domain-containing protein [Roseivirga pacifica]